MPSIDINDPGVQENALRDALADLLKKVNPQTGTSYTLLDTDIGKTILCTNASAITVTVPATMPVGYAVAIAQGGAGQVSLSGSNLNNVDTQTKTGGQYAVIGLICYENVGGSAAKWLVMGRTGA